MNIREKAIKSLDNMILEYESGTITDPCIIETALTICLNSGIITPQENADYQDHIIDIEFERILKYLTHF